MAVIEAIDWYDIPRYYDLVFDEETEQEAAFLEGIAERYGRGLAKTKRRVLEPACGSGRLLVAMAKRGWRVTGTDLSQPMLDYAKERLRSAGLKGKLVHGDMASPQPKGPFDLAHCFVSTFKYLLTEKAAVAHLRGVAAALAPGGVYVLGFHLTDYSRTKFERERWVIEKPDVEVVCNIQGWPPERSTRTEKVRSRLVVKEHGSTRRTETCWTFRTYDYAQVQRMLKKVPGLEHVETFDFTYDLGDPVPFTSDSFDTVLILRKQ